MRLLRILLALACLAAGIVVGALNTQLVRLDLGFTELTPSLGVSLILALLLGVLVGGLAMAASVVWPLRRRLARAERDAANAPPVEADGGA